MKPLPASNPTNAGEKYLRHPMFEIVAILFCAVGCLVFSGCGSRVSDCGMSQEQYLEWLRQEGYLGTNDTARMFTPEEFAACMKQEGLVGPDSLLSSEMRRRATVLFDVLYERSVVRDNWLLLTCDRSYVIEQGVPAVYYDLLVYNCWSMSEAVNRWIAEGRMTAEEGDLQRLFEEAKQARSFGRGVGSEVRKTADLQ